MKKKIIPLALKYALGTLALSSPSLYAADTPVKAIDGEVEAGAIITKGNSNTKNIHLKGKVSHQKTQWKHSLSAELNDASNDGKSTAERYIINGKSHYIINDSSDLFTSLEVEKDAFSGFNYRYSVVMGYNKQFSLRPNVAVNIGGGPGYRQSQLEQAVPGEMGLDKDVIGQVNGTLQWMMSDTATFREELTVETGVSGSTSRYYSELKLKIIGNLSAKLSYRSTYTSDIPASTSKKTDSEIMTTLAYTF